MLIPNEQDLHKPYVLRLDGLIRGDARRLPLIHNFLRAYQAHGDIDITYMDDDVAEIVVRNPAWLRFFAECDAEDDA